MHLSSNSKGNLLKGAYTYNGRVYFIKSGRVHVRGYTEWGVEPVVEVIVARLGRYLGIDVADQVLDVSTVERYNRTFNTLISVSPDFRNGKELIYLQDMYSLHEIENPYFEDLIHYGVDKEDLCKMLMLDLIILNEDRHNGNVAFLDNKLSPIYDNGYALLYDDIRGLCTNYVRAAKFCLCNAPIYHDSFYEAEKLWKKYGNRDMLQIDTRDISDAVFSVYNSYCTLVKTITLNNIPLPEQYWHQVIKFIEWRLQTLSTILKESTQ